MAKRAGVEKLTPAHALIAELVRRYWVVGIECSQLEIQKLAWFVERAIRRFNPDDTSLNLQFTAHRYGPYAERLKHLLSHLDGSYLHAEKRISDGSPLDVIWFDDTRKELLQLYLRTEAKAYAQALDVASMLINGFESPFGMELLATVDWLLAREGVAPTVPALREGLRRWPGGHAAAERKDRLFNDRVLDIALERLTQHATDLA